MGPRVPTGPESQTLTVGVWSKVSVYLQSAKPGEWAANAHKMEIPQWLSGRVIKDSVRGKDLRMYDQFVDLLVGYWLFITLLVIR